MVDDTLAGNTLLKAATAYEIESAGFVNHMPSSLAGGSQDPNA